MKRVVSHFFFSLVGVPVGVLVGALMGIPVCLHAQTGKGKMTQAEYIEKYKDIAIQQMHQYGVPASITLAQGCLESGNGNGRLAVEANNHFGIKCHEWEGEAIYHDDDQTQECFRRYASAEESFNDHSLFLKTRNRYQSLFDLNTTDYRGWAIGLKAAGYATNPKYAQLLINIIETNHLDKYDTYPLTPDMARRMSNRTSQQHTDRLEVPTFAQDDIFNVTFERRVHYDNGVPYVLAARGDTYESLAREFDLFKREIRRFNGVDKHTLPAVGDIIYLAKPPKKSTLKH